GLAICLGLGVLAALVRDTLTSFPHAVRWFVPLSPPSLPSAATYVAIGALLAAIPRGWPYRHLAMLLGGGAALAAVRPGLSRFRWTGEAVQVLTWVPLATVVLSTLSLRRRGWRPADDAGRG